MKKIALIFLLIIIAILFVIFMPQKSSESRLMRVVKDLNNTYKDLKQYASIYVLTLSNGQDMPHVVWTDDLDSFDEIIKEYKDINTEDCYIKIDIGFNKKEVTKEELKLYIISGMDNRFVKNILINDKYVLLNSDINYNGLLDFKDKSIKEEMVSSYIYKRDNIKIDAIEKIEIFDTCSSFMDQGSNIYHLYHSNKSFHIRKEKLTSDDILLALNTSKNMLFNMLLDDGKFVYGYDIINNTEYKDYNILRHGLAIWSLLKNYKLDENEKSKVEKAIDYLISQIVFNEDCAFVVEESAKGSEIKLGANGVALTAFCEYMNKYDSDKYKDIAIKIGTGILYCQNDDGSFNHIINPETFEVDSTFRTVLYDGEATLGLCKLYELTKDERYYNSAKLSMDYFIQNDYNSYNDHWMSYAANAFSQIDDDVKYIDFGIRNVAVNIDKLKYDNSTHHASYEQLFECYDLYKRALKNDIHLEIMDSFSIEDLEELIDYRTSLEWGSIMLPESAIYTKEPSKYMNIFYLRNDLSVRIDDLAHYINAFVCLANFENTHK